MEKRIETKRLLQSMKLIKAAWLHFDKLSTSDTPFRGVYPERVEGLQATQPALSSEWLPLINSQTTLGAKLDEIHR